MLGQNVIDGVCLLLDCRELLDKVLDSVGEEASQVDGASSKQTLSAAYISAKSNQR